jgi:putative phosphoribosyl transferase
MQPQIEPLSGGFESDVTVRARGLPLGGRLTVPRGAAGVVVFAHGSGSSCTSPRNRRVARALQGAGMGTLLFDLLTESEELEEMRGAMQRFDIAMLAERIIGASEWLAAQPGASGLDIAYFGASTGAAAALVAAARRPANVRAVVSRGGRPDLAGDWLARVIAPVLLLVGELDGQVIALNRQAQAALPASELVIVPRAGHLFEEPGALDEVARHAARWLSERFRAERAAG